MIGGMVPSLLRLLTLQASWSHDRLQGIGAAVSAEPLLRGLAGEPEDEAFQRALGRAAQHFNSHPYLAGLAIGALSRAELDGVDPERIGRLRAALKGPLGSLGDRIVWAATLPFAASVGLILAARWSPWAGAAAFLGLFNVVHFAFLFWGLPTGWRLGLSVGQALSHPLIQGGVRILAPAAVVAVGVAVPVVGERVLAGLGPGSVPRVIGVGLLGVVILKWLMPSVGAARLGLIAAGLAFVGGWIWP